VAPVGPGFLIKEISGPINPVIPLVNPGGDTYACATKSNVPL
jgi:hypothetical protein